MEEDQPSLPTHHAPPRMERSGRRSDLKYPPLASAGWRPMASTPRRHPRCSRSKLVTCACSSSRLLYGLSFPTREGVCAVRTMRMLMAFIVFGLCGPAGTLICAGTTFSFSCPLPSWSYIEFAMIFKKELHQRLEKPLSTRMGWMAGGDRASPSTNQHEPTLRKGLWEVDTNTQ